MTHHENQCLNCGAPLSAAFCAACGQKASTHRFSLAHIFSHDMIHGIFHLDKGFLFTAKELLVRPGRMTSAYIAGSRNRYFNYFTFLLLLVAVNHFIITSSHFKLSDLYGTPENRSRIDQLQLYLVEHYRQLLLVTIPVFSAFSFLVFRKARMNFAEHLVMNTYRQGGELMVQTIMLLLFLPFRHLPQAKFLYPAFTMWATVYSLWFYIQFFRPYYKSVFWTFQRSMLVWICTSMVMAFVANLLVEIAG